MLCRLFPERCPSCHGPTGRGFCAGCREDFPAIRDPCARCALPHEPALCPDGWMGSSLTATVAPFRYAPPLDRYVHALKFGGTRKLGRALGLLLADTPSIEPRVAHASSIDALVPVPLHPRRLRQRGYNQAVEISRTLARELRVPLLLRGVLRRVPTPPQAGLSASRRRINMADAFDIRHAVDGMRLAVIDDVITTGATVNSLAGALREAGARSVEAWAVARTLGRGSGTEDVVEHDRSEHDTA
jgi:ComF family protein